MPSERQAQEHMEYNVATARQYVREGRAEEWINLYLHTPPWGQVKIWRFLRRRRLSWIGPVEVELSQLRRTCGPEKGMRYEEDAEYWENAVTEIADGLRDPAALPPLLVCHDRGDFVILDGNHRHEAFRRRGWCSAWVLIGC